MRVRAARPGKDHISRRLPQHTGQSETEFSKRLARNEFHTFRKTAQLRFEMEMLILTLSEYGALLIFGAVLLEQLGVPIPAFAFMIISGSLLPPAEAAQHVAIAAMACVLADVMWFYVGKRYGTVALKSVCRATLAKDSCLDKAMQRLARFGPATLLVSRFVPGLGLVVAPGSGALGFSPLSFVFFSALSGLIWSATAIVSGILFKQDVRTILQIMEHASSALFAIAAAALAYVFFLRVARYRSRKANEKKVESDQFSIA